MIPEDVMLSPAFGALSSTDIRVLVTLAVLYNGHNNGDLCLTRAIGRPYHLNDEHARTHGLRKLVEVGIAVKTREGGKKPMRPTAYALTFQPLNYFDGIRLAVPRPPSHDYEAYGKNKTTATTVVVPTATTVVVDGGQNQLRPS